MNAGNMNQRITIRELTEGKDEMGNPKTVPVDWATVWGELLIGFGREFYGAKKMNTELSGIIKIHYRSGLKARAFDVEYGNRVFEIIAVIDPGERHRELELHIKEVIM